MSSLKAILPTDSFWVGKSRSVTAAVLIEPSCESDSCTVSGSAGGPMVAGRGAVPEAALAVLAPNPEYMAAAVIAAAATAAAPRRTSLDRGEKIARRMTEPRSRASWRSCPSPPTRATETIHCEDSQFRSDNRKAQNPRTWRQCRNHQPAAACSGRHIWLRVLFLASLWQWQPQRRLPAAPSVRTFTSPPRPPTQATPPHPCRRRRPRWTLSAATPNVS